MTDVMNDEQPVELDAVPLEPAALREATNDELVAQLALSSQRVLELYAGVHNVVDPAQADGAPQAAPTAGFQARARASASAAAARAGAGAAAAAT